MAKIIQIERKQVTTSFGEKEKFNVTIEQDGKQIKADSFIGRWNANWAIGDEIDIKKEQWKQRDYNGRTYWSIMAPPESRSGFGNNSQEVADLKIKVNNLSSIINEFVEDYGVLLEELKRERASKVKPEETDDDSILDEIPVVSRENNDDEIKIEDVPF